MSDQDTLRRLIRDIIGEEVATIKRTAALSTEPSTMMVSITRDADLATFARDVLRLAEDPRARDAIMTRTYPFHLSAGPTSEQIVRTMPASHALGSGSGHTTSGHSKRVDKGVVTEAFLAALPPGTTRLALAAGVTITPLARDKAKALNISIERIRQ